MKKINLLLLLITAVVFSISSRGQIVKQVLSEPGNSELVSCGTPDFSNFVESKNKGFSKLSDQLMGKVSRIARNRSVGNDEVYQIPIVFHSVYHSEDENIHDSVFIRQVEILNECYRRQNADTVNLRPEFQGLVADSKIEFVLAEMDPFGNASTGITRTYTDIEYFGGVIPFSPGQNQEISEWVNDSLFYNFFRISQDSLGGKSSWNPDQYLNIWVGDLRIFEPHFDNFEELVFMAFGTPPLDHENWPSETIDFFEGYADGVFMHYVTLSDNNPVPFPSPYHVYNGVVNTGKLLVHEIGHYLGLRHIWGDGDCTMDDYVFDTPRASAASQFNCNMYGNTCLDTINGEDLPNMVENFMDYSSGDCQNSFTQGQVDIMRTVIEIYRPNLDEPVGIDNAKKQNTQILIYPNPNQGYFKVDLGQNFDHVKLNVKDILGRTLLQKQDVKDQIIDVNIEGVKGIYFVEIISNDKTSVFKVIKQ